MEATGVSKSENINYDTLSAQRMTWLFDIKHSRSNEPGNVQSLGLQSYDQRFATNRKGNQA